MAVDARPHRPRIPLVRDRPSHFQRAIVYPDDSRSRCRRRRDDRSRRLGDPRAGGAYLAGPLYDGEGILYADLDPAVLWARQRFDAAGHYHRPDVLCLR